jgi:hypothetical protein
MRAPIEASAYPSLREHACLYPDGRPAAERRPYLYRAGKVYGLQPHSEQAPTLDAVAVELDTGNVPLGEALDGFEAAPLARRVPVLAVGSNGYPRQLLDKFSVAALGDDSVVVLGCTLRDASIGYCASLSVRNGYVPVTLVHEPGATTHSWLQWLTPAQLRLIAETEGTRYSLVECGRRADGSAAVAIHGVSAVPQLVYGWVFDARLQLAGEAIARFAGNPPQGYVGDPAGVEQEAILQDVVERTLQAQGGALTWDGCTLPSEWRMAVRDFLIDQGDPNTIPAHWEVVDRGHEGFAEALADAPRAAAD